jgi:hypothetical protein
MPRMKAVSVVLVPREAFRVVFGTVSVRAVMSGIALFSSSAPEIAVTAPGTSWISSARRRAVTTTWFMLSDAEAAAGAAVEAVVRAFLGMGYPDRPPVDRQQHGGRDGGTV